MHLRLLSLGVLAGLFSCSETVPSQPVYVDVDPIEPGSDAGDAGDTPDAAEAQDAADTGFDPIKPTPGCGWTTGKLNLLLVVDNSHSMHAEQALLAQELPRMVSALASGDVDGDGEQDHPAADIRVGVVTTDMGLSGQVASLTGCSAYGGNAILRQPAACSASGPGYLAYDPEHTDAEELECLVKIGVDGCGIEQPLEAMLKALTPSTSEIRFARDTFGHGDGPNAGFLREDSVLAIVHVTDEDDCSLRGPTPAFSNYNGEPPYDAVGVNYRCAAFPEILHPTSRYIDALKSLRPLGEGSIFYALIAGVPLDLTTGNFSPQQILDDPRMAYTPDNEDLKSAILMPACGAERSATDKVSASPARRMIEVAEGFGDHAVITSICEQTFQAPIEAIAKRLGGVLACPDAPVIF